MPITKDSPGVEIQLIAESEHYAPEGHFDSGEPELDAKDAAEIRARLDRGDEWAWFCAHVRVTFDGITADDYLGGCCYKDESDFRADGYFSDMVSTCIDAINTAIAAQLACELAPHNKAIIACACGYKRAGKVA